jgi:hypothetical protein
MAFELELSQQGRLSIQGIAQDALVRAKKRKTSVMLNHYALVDPPHSYLLGQSRGLVCAYR